MTFTITPDTSQPCSPLEQKTLSRLAALCSKSEHCEGDITEKLRRTGLDPQAEARIMQCLTADGYIDDRRYARAFVHDKRLYNGWGPEKVRQGLIVKGVSRDIAAEAVGQVTAAEWLDALRPAIAQKRRTLSADDPYTRRQKLLRYAASRGFSLSQAIDAIGEE